MKLFKNVLNQRLPLNNTLPVALWGIKNRREMARVLAKVMAPVENVKGISDVA